MFRMVHEVIVVIGVEFDVHIKGVLAGVCEEGLNAKKCLLKLIHVRTEIFKNQDIGPKSRHIQDEVPP